MKIKNRRAFICGIKSLKLSKKEIKFIKKFKPWGIILFSRNIKTISQAKKLTNNIKKLFNDHNYPILIDEEGGRVSRLKSLIDNSVFSPEYFGNLYSSDKKKFYIYSKVYVKQISYLLKLIGINVNNVPVLDLRRKRSHKIIGDRSYSTNPRKVAILGNKFISIFHENRIATVIKHIPGHGLAKVDSHKKIPYVNKSLKYLLKNDFFTFKRKKSLFAMTSHVVFNKLDPFNCVTHSSKIINLIRKKIGFKNIIISDDISMKALKYSISINTYKAFKSGCNLVLHCNGKMNEMINVAENSPKIDKFIIKKTTQFKNMLN